MVDRLPSTLCSFVVTSLCGSCSLTTTTSYTFVSTTLAGAAKHALLRFAEIFLDFREFTFRNGPKSLGRSHGEVPRNTKMRLFRFIMTSYTSQVHGRSAVRTPFRTVSPRHSANKPVVASSARGGRLNPIHPPGEKVAPA